MACALSPLRAFSLACGLLSLAMCIRGHAKTLHAFFFWPSARFSDCCVGTFCCLAWVGERWGQSNNCVIGMWVFSLVIFGWYWLATRFLQFYGVIIGFFALLEWIFWIFGLFRGYWFGNVGVLVEFLGCFAIINLGMRDFELFEWILLKFQMFEVNFVGF